MLKVWHVNRVRCNRRSSRDAFKDFTRAIDLSRTPEEFNVDSPGSQAGEDINKGFPDARII
jgi:hypothetical protein